MPKQKQKFTGFDIEEFIEFRKKLERAQKKDFKEQCILWVEMMGLEFLDLVQQQIIANGTVDTRRLLKSFTRGSSDNIWRTQYGGLQIEIGTDVPYAVYVNDGHWTTPTGVAQRWVPGRWVGNKFIYEPGAKTGMLLKRKFVEGSHYWEQALAIYERMFDKKVDEQLQIWINRYFG